MSSALVSTRISASAPRTSADDITVEEEDFLVVTDESINLGLESARKGRLASTRETSEPVGGTGSDRHSGVIRGSLNHFVFVVGVGSRDVVLNYKLALFFAFYSLRF